MYYSLKTIRVWICCTFLIALSIQKSGAGSMDIDIPGMSYHIGANSQKPAYSNATLGIDNNGALVVNPGIGIGYDFRKKIARSGFSGIIKAIYFRDCDFRPFILGGGGVRYRYMFIPKLSVDANILGMLIAGQDWQASAYNFSFTPFPMLGLNYHFKNEIMLGVNFTLSPKNESHSATGGFWIIFTMIQLSFPIG